MRPLAMLIGIVTGSAVSMAAALAMTLVVFLLLPDQAQRVGEEMWPLARTAGCMFSLAAVGAAAGTMLLGSLAGIVDSVQGSASWLVVIVGITFVLAVVAAIAAAVLVSHAERHASSSSVKAVSPAPDGRWISF